MSWLVDWYYWLKALHVIAMVAWMAGMLYLPRLFVYHAGAKPGGELAETLKVMERRLLRAIINPAMLATWLFGLLLLGVPGLIDWGSGWLYGKLAAVLALSVLHGFFARWRKDFTADRNAHTARFYRFANEVPTVLLVTIVILVLVKPF